MFFKGASCRLGCSIYIDDQVRSLKEVCLEVLAYADDVAIICKNRQELDKVIVLLKNWTTTNEIAVNKKKREESL